MCMFNKVVLGQKKEKKKRKWLTFQLPVDRFQVNLLLLSLSTVVIN